MFFEALFFLRWDRIAVDGAIGVPRSKLLPSIRVTDWLKRRSLEQSVGLALLELSVDGFCSASRGLESMSASNRVALVDARAKVGRERIVTTGEAEVEDEEMVESEDGKTRTKDE